MTTQLTKSKTALYFIVVASFLGCQDENIVNDDLSSLNMLTSKEWKLVAHGFDDNKNNKLDPEENQIEDCQKDNTYDFFPNGKGNAGNDIPCGGESNFEFDWIFLENDKLEIAYQNFSIVKLNEHELVLSPELPGVTTQFLLHYTH